MKVSKTVFGLFFVFLFSGFVYSFDFKLLNDTLVLGQSQQAVASIVNRGTEPLAIEVYPVARSYSVDGEEKQDEAFDQLVVFPSQMILGPNEEQTVAIRWVGPVMLEKERPFRLVAENVPIEVTTANYGQRGKKSGQLRMLYRIVKSFYVLPQGNVSPQLRVVSASSQQQKDGEYLVVKLVNAGSCHTIVNKMTFDVVFASAKSPKNSVVIPVDFDLIATHGGVNFLAGEERNVRLKFSKNWVIPSGYQPYSAVIKSVIYSTN